MVQPQKTSFPDKFPQGVLLPFFYTLRSLKVPVGTSEWLALMQACVEDLHDTSLDQFYYMARAILVKSEALYDAYDQAFILCFKELEGDIDLRQEILEWLDKKVDPSNRPSLPQVDPLTLQELRKKLLERLQQQKEQHHGGSHWIGTGGTSPFGHSGAHPSGIRIGGPGGGRMAAKIAEERKFANYRHDRVLDTRQLKVALKRLRRLDHEGRQTELNIDKSIALTCKNAGEIELVFEAPKKNQTELLLLMDVGGTMDTYAELVESLFSAAHGLSHFKAFKHFYFHNCFYSKFYIDMLKGTVISMADLFKNYRNNFRVIIVGDACMHPYELFSPGGAIDYWDIDGRSGHHADLVASQTGIDWVKRLKEHYPATIWLNPEPKRVWEHPTISAIARVIPMFPLTVEGLGEAVDWLRAKD